MKYAVPKISLIFLLLSATASLACDFSTHYATLVYEKEEQLSRFNKRISVRGFSGPERRPGIATVSDEVIYKVDSLIEKVEILLHVCPRSLRFGIMLLSTKNDVQQQYKMQYGIGGDYVAFYSPQNRTLFVSVDDIDNYVLAHELTHVVIDQYFEKSPSAVIQEILAHFVETHIEF